MNECKEPMKCPVMDYPLFFTNTQIKRKTKQNVKVKEWLWPIAWPNQFLMTCAHLSNWADQPSLKQITLLPPRRAQWAPWCLGQALLDQTS